MKRTLALAAIAILTVSLAAIAHDHGSEKAGGSGKTGEKTAAGTIAKLDPATQTLTLTDAKGAGSTIQWNDATRILGGELKEGAAVKVGYTESDGKMWATWIKIGESGK